MLHHSYRTRIKVASFFFVVFFVPKKLNQGLARILLLFVIYFRRYWQQQLNECRHCLATSGVRFTILRKDTSLPDSTFLNGTLWSMVRRQDTMEICKTASVNICIFVLFTVFFFFFFFFIFVLLLLLCK